MKTVFRVGMGVYDQLNFPNKEGKVEEIYISDEEEYPIVSFGERERVCYSPDGSLSDRITKTLSTKPYKVVFDGFEQKAPAPTFEEAVKWLESTEGTNIMNNSVFLTKGNYYTNLNECMEALRKLIILRDYYNEGWQPDWNNRQRDKFGIMVDKNMLCKESFQSNNKPLAFKSREILDRFFEEQRKLLEIAKPLL
jgi:hypothetical protein